ncbi:MAG: SPFH domain-containing protein [Pseudomonadota bacterium]
MKKNRQNSIFSGIYEFEDPSGSLMAAKVPHIGSADLYAGTAVIVRPNQQAVLIYKGEVTDILGEGTHEIETGNVPILTRLANWRFGFRSPLRCELWFFSTQIYTARRWGTYKPVLIDFEGMKSVPIRAFGNYNLYIKDSIRFYKNLIGSRNDFDISELEEFVQGQLLELLPQALEMVTKIERLNRDQDAVSKRLRTLANQVLIKYGIQVTDLQVLSILPSDEIIQALDTRLAMNIIGDKQEFLLYQAANSLNELGSGGANQSNDPLQMMLGLMLGKNLMDSDFRAKEKPAKVRMRALASKEGPSRQGAEKFCHKCGAPVGMKHNFCGSCGAKLK